MADISDAELKEFRDMRREFQLMKDKQAILEVMHKYARAMDRHDWDLLRAEIYHPDAIDDHGRIVGTPNAMIARYESIHEERYRAQEHIILNHLSEIDGDVAHAETYYLSFCPTKDGKTIETAHGRYIDRLEKRDGKWKIALRQLVRDAYGVMTATDDLMPDSKRDKSDPVYQRPLTLRPERAALLKR